MKQVPVISINNRKVSGKLKLGLLALAMLTTTTLYAADSGWYVGGSVGQATTDLDQNFIYQQALSTGASSVTGITKDDREKGYKLFTGYQFNKNFAIEGEYADLGKFKYNSTMLPASTLSGDIRFDTWAIDAVGILPLSGNFSAFGKLGLSNTSAKDVFSSTRSSQGKNNYRDTSYTYGAGLKYAISDNFGMRLEAERFHLKGNSGTNRYVDLLSLGLEYRFGSKPAPVVAKAPAPAAPVAAPAPKPAAPTPPPPPPAPRKVSLDADSLFDFNSDVMKPAGRQKMDKLISDLAGVDYDTIMVTGHTDRIGSKAYNQKLSEHRADAVKKYLVENGKLPASKISTKGMDGSDPVTKMSDCPATLDRASLITCLAPDRRVEVEVAGTRPR